METEADGRYVAITGFEGVRIEDFQTFFLRVHEAIKGCHIQFFDADLVASWEHLHFAVLNAMRAFNTGLNISRETALEALLYASGQHQIKRAVELLGIKPDSSNVAVLIIAETREAAADALETVSGLLHGAVNDEILELNPEKIKRIRRMFNISDLEMKAGSREEGIEKTFVNLVIEHVALATKQR